MKRILFFLWTFLLLLTPFAAVQAQDVSFLQDVFQFSQTGETYSVTLPDEMAFQEALLQFWNTNEQEIYAFMISSYVAIGVVSFLFHVFSGFVMLIFLKKPIAQTSLATLETPWKNLGMGLVFCCVVPLVTILLWSSFIGISLGFFLMFCMAMIMFFVKTFAGLIVGQKIIAYDEQSSYFTILGSFVLGSFIVSFVSLIPVVGWVFYAMLIFLYTGSMLRYLYQVRSSLICDDLL